jgi:hypothetical protein
MFNGRHVWQGPSLKLLQKAIYQVGREPVVGSPEATSMKGTKSF